ncbi:hypothetical protein BH23GEM11_BH23GEM11_18520 [soil metagenome]
MAQGGRWGRGEGGSGGKVPVGMLITAMVLLGGCELRGGPGERIRGEGFELRCDPGCGPGAAELVADLGRTRDSVAVWFGLDPALAPSVLDGEGRLRIRLYASEGPFLRADRRLASGRFAQQQAFSHQRSRSAHVLAEGSPDPRRWERFGPGFQGERLAVHEAAHLVTYARAQDARWPSWVSEGIAAHAEERWAAGRSGAAVAPKPGEREDEPWLHTQRHARVRLLDAGGLPESASLIRSDLARLPLATRYAVWAAFMGVLLEEPFRARTRDFLGELAGPAPARGWTSEWVAQRFEARFDPATLSAVDARLREALRAGEVTWVELRRSAGWTPEGLLQVPVRFDPLLWRPWSSKGALPPAGLTLRAVAEPVGPATSSGSGMLLVLGILDGRPEEQAVGVIVRTNASPQLVRVPLRSDALPSSWTGPGAPSAVAAPEATGPTVAREGGTSFPGAHSESGVTLELVLDAERLTLRVGGIPQVHWLLPGVRASGGWGVGTSGGLPVLWRELGLAADSHGRDPGAGAAAGALQTH